VDLLEGGLARGASEGGLEDLGRALVARPQLQHRLHLKAKPRVFIIDRSIYVTIYLYLSFEVFMSLYISICLSICSTGSTWKDERIVVVIFLSIYFISIFLCPSFYLPIYLSVCLSVLYISIYLSFYLSIYLSV
jgi:hypothetical protein